MSEDGRTEEGQLPERPADEATDAPAAEEPQAPEGEADAPEAPEEEAPAPPDEEPVASEQPPAAEEAPPEPPAAADAAETPPEQPAAEAPPAEPAPEQPVAEQPEAEEPAAEQAESEAAPEQPQGQQPAAEEPAPEQPAAAPPAAEQPQAEQPSGEQPAADEQPAAEQAQAPAQRRRAGGEGAEPKSDLPPGAELDPITLEPERELSAEERARVEAEAEERARREAEATAESSEEPVAVSEPRVQLEAERLVQATGKRKSSVARVLVRAGSGTFEVNGRRLEQYFPRPHLQAVARQALVTTGYEETVDVRVRVHGGGISGQAGAIGHGVARALTDVDPDLRGELKRRGLLTRDARIKERRKAGLKKARKRPQFSKR
jgi:small subunit ribosomal protein S9